MIARINNADLFYATSGNGRPLLLMHGGMGLDHTYFRPWLDPLSEHMQVIYYDHRGNGRSSSVEDFGKFDPGIWADDANLLIKHLGHDKIILLGHSFGGFVAQDFMRRHSDRVAGLILCSTAPAMDHLDVVMANAQARCTPEQLAVVLKMFTEPIPDDAAMKERFHAILPIYFKSYDPAVGAAVVNGIRYNHHAFNFCGSWLPSINNLSLLGDITVPTLLITGRFDWSMPPAQGAERLHARIRGSQLAIFENSGHMPFMEEQEAFVKLVSGWIAGLG